MHAIDLDILKNIWETEKLKLKYEDLKGEKFINEITENLEKRFYLVKFGDWKIKKIV